VTLRTATVRLVGSILIAALVLGACGGSEDRSEPARLPPSTRAGLVQLFERDVAAQGFRITRAALQDVTRPPYGRSPHGTHVAIYLEPTGPTSPAGYADSVLPTARIFLPAVFRRWKGVESFDLCLEPAPGVDDSPEPPPVTSVYVERSGGKSVNWGTLSLTDLQRLARKGVNLYLSDPVRAEAASRG
jgi:hypothetical protein